MNPSDHRPADEAKTATSISTSETLHTAKGVSAQQTAADIFARNPRDTATNVRLQEDGPSELAKSLIGTRIGPYNIERQLGAGGMGEVYLARREDELKMSVAVKLIKAGQAGSDMLTHFNRERQLLADLKHPHIAMLLDGGNHQGQPYFMMEYIEGQTIEKWAAKYNPSPADLLQVFRKVVAAVGFAHGKGVIHRDIKPGILMVTPEGEPKLLDFGIALLTQPGAEGAQADFAMTPEYASPEQKWGQVVKAPSDIYSLALVLVQLITGTSPRRLGKPPLEAVEDLSCLTSPTFVSGKTVQRRPPGTAGDQAPSDLGDAMDFSANGSLPATPSDDQTIRLWHMDRFFLPPDGEPPREWFAEALKRSLNQMGYRLDGINLHPQPRMRLQGVNHNLEPSPYDHLDAPRPANMHYGEWLMKGRSRPNLD